MTHTGHHHYCSSSAIQAGISRILLEYTFKPDSFLSIIQLYCAAHLNWTGSLETASERIITETKLRSPSYLSHRYLFQAGRVTNKPQEGNFTHGRPTRICYIVKDIIAFSSRSVRD